MSSPDLLEYKPQMPELNTLELPFDIWLQSRCNTRGGYIQAMLGNSQQGVSTSQLLGMDYTF